MSNSNTTPIICGACRFSCYELAEMNQHMADRHGKPLFADIASPSPSPKAEAAIEHAMRKSHEQQEAMRSSQKLDEILRRLLVGKPHTTVLDRIDDAKAEIESLIDAAIAEAEREALYDLYEYMGQFPDDLNLAVMYERIKEVANEPPGVVQIEPPLVRLRAKRKDV